MKATKCPTDELSLKNRAIIHPSELGSEKYIDVSTGPGSHFVFAIERSPEVPPRCVGFSLLQRKWATLSINQVCVFLQGKNVLIFSSFHIRIRILMLSLFASKA